MFGSDSGAEALSRIDTLANDAVISARKIRAWIER